MNDFNKPLQPLDFIKQKRQQFGSAWTVCSWQNHSAVHVFFGYSVSLFLVQAAITMHQVYEIHFLVPGESEVHEQLFTGKCYSNYNAAYYIKYGLYLNRPNYTLIKYSFCSLFYNQEILIVPLVAQLAGWKPLVWKRRNKSYVKKTKNNNLTLVNLWLLTAY